MTATLDQNPAGPKTPETAPPITREFRLAVIVLGALLACFAIAFNYVSFTQGLHFKKLAVEITKYGKPLKELPTDLGPWKMVSVDQRLSGDIEHVLGTTEYVMRQYVDTRVVNKEQVDQILGTKSLDERNQLISRLWTTKPDAVVSISLTYYTGMVDTVAHIPERCFVASGMAEKANPEEVALAIGPEAQTAKVRFIEFEGQTARDGKSVAYLFNVNGEETSNSIVVRQKLQNLFERYGYYAKVELMTIGLPKESSQAVMGDYLKSALPEINKCLPDWEKVLDDAKAAK